jgi:hypothetical protein
MSILRPVSVAAFLLLVVAGTSGCNNSAAAPTAPSATLKIDAANNALTVDPVPLQTQFLPGAACSGFQPFGMRFKVIVTPSPHGRFVNGFSFGYLDGRGVRVTPFAIPGIVEGAVPSTGNIGVTSTGVPTNGPILVPGEISSIFFVNPSSRAVAPFTLRFRCGYAPFGLLSIGVSMTDQLGKPMHMQFAVDVVQPH